MPMAPLVQRQVQFWKKSIIISIFETNVHISFCKKFFFLQKKNENYIYFNSDELYEKQHFMDKKIIYILRIRGWRVNPKRSRKGPIMVLVNNGFHVGLVHVVFREAM